MTSDQKIQNVLSRLSGVTQTGQNQWKARCPAHDDQHASLSVSIGQDGRVLLHCHATCSLMSIRNALGLSWDDIGPVGQSSFKDGAEIVAEYDYRSASGKLLYQVVRMEPKDFRQRRPDGNGGWIWKMSGVDRVLYRLPELLAADKDQWVFIVEGEKDADNLARLGLIATTNPGGAGKWSKLSDDSALHGRKVAIIPDRDEPGKEHARNVAASLRSKASEVKIIELPGEDKDVSDWLNAGGSKEQLMAIIEQSSPADDEYCDCKPRILLPGGSTSIRESGRKFGQLLSQTDRYYVRGGIVVTLDRDDHDFQILTPVRSASMASILESVAVPTTIVKIEKQLVEVATVCSEQTAKMIMHASTFLEALPRINVLSRCPVMIERDGCLQQVCGYDRQTGILALGPKAPDVNLDQAVMMLRDMLEDFKYASPSDRSRAMAAIITPALIFGGLLKGRAPIDLGEADKSQTGKGYRNKLTAAIYRHNVRTVTQRKGGGVGSLEETFNSALVQGMNFISLDNIRGNIDSPAIESFLTEDIYYARIPYHGSVAIDPRHVMVLMTSNKADITPDLANRSCCVNIHKRPEGYQFKKYSDGDILDHVRANQPLYLGAVFAVIRAWHEAGKPASDESRHDFRDWARTMDWIVQNLLNCPPLLEGHRQTQLRMSNPTLNWLRDVALAVRDAGQTDKWLRTNQLVEIIACDGNIEIPGLAEGDDMVDEGVRKKIFQGVGRRMSICFGKDNVRNIENMVCERKESPDPQYRSMKEYLFKNGGDGLKTPLVARYYPASHPAKEPQYPANPANGTPDFLYARKSQSDSAYKNMLPTHSGYSGVLGNNSGVTSGRIAGSNERLAGSNGVPAEEKPDHKVGEKSSEVKTWRA